MGRCLPLFHLYVPVAAHEMKVWPPNGGQRPVEIYTEILERCVRCPQSRTVRREGTWSLEQITTDPGKTP